MGLTITSSALIFHRSYSSFHEFRYWVRIHVGFLPHLHLHSDCDGDYVPSQHPPTLLRGSLKTLAEELKEISAFETRMPEHVKATFQRFRTIVNIHLQEGKTLKFE